jgi:hypothetical protein
MQYGWVEEHRGRKEERRRAYSAPTNRGTIRGRVFGFPTQNLLVNVDNNVSTVFPRTFLVFSIDGNVAVLACEVLKGRNRGSMK